MIFLKGVSKSLSEVKSQARQLLAPQYLTDLKEAPVAAQEKVASVYVLASDLDGKANWDMADMTGDLDLGSWATLLGGYGRVLEVCWLIIESVPLLGVDQLSLAIRVVEVISRASILELHVYAQEPKLSSYNSLLG